MLNWVHDYDLNNHSHGNRTYTEIPNGSQHLHSIWRSRIQIQMQTETLIANVWTKKFILAYAYLLKVALLIRGVHKVSSLTEKGMNTGGNYHCFNLSLFARWTWIYAVAGAFCHRKWLACKCRLQRPNTKKLSKTVAVNQINLSSGKWAMELSKHLINFQWIAIKETSICRNYVPKLNTDYITRNKDGCVLLNPPPVSKDLT